MKVALGGDGYDDLIAGYHLYLAHKYAAFCDKLPGFLCCRVIDPLVDRLPALMDNL